MALIILDIPDEKIRQAFTEMLDDLREGVEQEELNNVVLELFTRQSDNLYFMIDQAIEFAPELLKPVIEQ